MPYGILLMEAVIMKKIVSFVLVTVLVLGLGVTVLAADSPATDGEPHFRVCDPLYLELCNDDDEVIALVPWREVLVYQLRFASRLNDEEEAQFLSEYENAKNIEDKVVKYFYWLNIPDEYKTEDVAYAKYYFTCIGKNVELTVNGKQMEVLPSDQGGLTNYYAKLTEFGAIAIMCD